MGAAIAQRLHNAGHTVFGFDQNKHIAIAMQLEGIAICDSLQDLATKTNIFWLMIPVGKPIDDTLTELKKYIAPQSIIIDGGNSKWTDSQRRAQQLKKDNIDYLDCGTSGGLKGRDIGFSLMVGGDRKAYESIVTFLRAIAMSHGFGYVGSSGAGHYVKMVHNGIEYALLQSYAEGFQLIKEGSFARENLDLSVITGIWQHGSVIRSWLLDLSHDILKNDQLLTDISGVLDEGGTGKWTVEDAKANCVMLPMIEEAVKIRKWSRETGGNYATKIVALLRKAFGGHSIYTKKG